MSGNHASADRGIVDDEGQAQTALANDLATRRDVEHFDSASRYELGDREIGCGLLRCFALDIDTLELSST